MSARVDGVAAVVLEALCYPPSERNMEKARRVAEKVLAHLGEEDARSEEQGR